MIALRSSTTSQTLTFMAAVTMPSRCQKAMNWRSARLPRTDDRVGRIAVADVLHAQVVLIREEIRQPGVGRGVTGGVGPGGEALVEGVGPVLDAQVTAVVGVPGGSDVARGVHAGRAGLQLLVDDDAVVDLQAGRDGQLDSGGDPDADDDDIGVLDVAVAQDDVLDGVGAAQLGDSGPQPQLHAVVGVQAAEHLTDLVAQDAVQGRRGGVDEDDLGAHLSSGRGDLRADPTGSNHRHATGGANGVAEPDRIADRAEVVDAGEIGSGDVEVARLGAGRHDSGRERQVLVAVEEEVASVGVEGFDGASRQQLDVVGRIEALVVDACRLRRDLAAQHRLGQRGSLVRGFVLVADEHDTPVEAGGAGTFSRFGAGNAGADDHERGVGRHRRLTPAGGWGRRWRGGPGSGRRAAVRSRARRRRSSRRSAGG